MQSTINSQSCPWDGDRLALIAASAEEERAIIALLLSQGEKTIAGLQSAMAAENQMDWRRAAHTLAGAAANLGMDALLSQCRKAEALILPSGECAANIGAIEQALQDIALYKPPSER